MRYGKFEQSENLTRNEAEGDYKGYPLISYMPLSDGEDKRIVNKNVKNIRIIYEQEQSFNLDGDGGYKAKEIEIKLERKIKCLDYKYLIGRIEPPCRKDLEKKCAYVQKK